MSVCKYCGMETNFPDGVCEHCGRKSSFVQKKKSTERPYDKDRLKKSTNQVDFGVSKLEDKVNEWFGKGETKEATLKKFLGGSWFVVLIMFLIHPLLGIFSGVILSNVRKQVNKQEKNEE